MFRIIELRNLISHNWGVVNRTYRRRVGDDSMVLGDLAELDVEDVFRDLDVLAHSAVDIDERAVSKWELPSLKFKPRPLFDSDS